MPQKGSEDEAYRQEDEALPAAEGADGNVEALTLVWRRYGLQASPATTRTGRQHYTLQLRQRSDAVFRGLSHLNAQGAIQ